MTRFGNRRRGDRFRRRFRRFVLVILLAATGWAGGLIWFAGQVPRTPADNTETTDVIVVLTGGTGRLEAGLQLLAAKRAQSLFVSGVARGVDVAALLRVARRSPDNLACCIAVGYKADDTAGNAAETAVWMEQRGSRSLTLVTANYHMPRSLLEFRRAMPTARIVAHPVFPEQFKSDSWWRFRGPAMLLASEYNKFLIARLALGDGVRQLTDRIK